jgi:hypothetical protein
MGMRLSLCGGCAKARDASIRAAFAINSIRIIFQKHCLGRKRCGFDKTFFLILNLAVGADCTGNPDSTTRFPQMTQVDYVGVYQLLTIVASGAAFRFRNTHGRPGIPLKRFF